MGREYNKGRDVFFTVRLTGEETTLLEMLQDVLGTRSRSDTVRRILEIIAEDLGLS